MFNRNERLLDDIRKDVRLTLEMLNQLIALLQTLIACGKSASAGQLAELARDHLDGLIASKEKQLKELQDCGALRALSVRPGAKGKAIYFFEDVPCAPAGHAEEITGQRTPALLRALIEKIQREGSLTANGALADVLYFNPVDCVHAYFPSGIPDKVSNLVNGLNTRFNPQGLAEPIVHMPNDNEYPVEMNLIKSFGDGKVWQLLTIYHDALAAVRTGDQARAVTQLKLVLELDPANYPARYELVRLGDTSTQSQCWLTEYRYELHAANSTLEADHENWRDPSYADLVLNIRQQRIQEIDSMFGGSASVSGPITEPFHDLIEAALAHDPGRILALAIDERHPAYQLVRSTVGWLRTQTWGRGKSDDELRSLVHDTLSMDLPSQSRAYLLRIQLSKYPAARLRPWLRYRALARIGIELFGIQPDGVQFHLEPDRSNCPDRVSAAATALHERIDGKQGLHVTLVPAGTGLNQLFVGFRSAETVLWQAVRVHNVAIEHHAREQQKQPADRCPLEPEEHARRARVPRAALDDLMQLGNRIRQVLDPAAGIADWDREVAAAADQDTGLDDARPVLESYIHAAFQTDLAVKQEAAKHLSELLEEVGGHCKEEALLEAIVEPEQNTGWYGLAMPLYPFAGDQIPDWLIRLVLEEIA